MEYFLNRMVAFLWQHINIITKKWKVQSININGVCFAFMAPCKNIKSSSIYSQVNKDMQLNCGLECQEHHVNLLVSTQIWCPKSWTGRCPTWKWAWMPFLSREICQFMRNNHPLKKKETKCQWIYDASYWATHWLITSIAMKVLE